MQSIPTHLPSFSRICLSCRNLNLLLLFRRYVQRLNRIWLLLVYIPTIFHTIAASHTDLDSRKRMHMLSDKNFNICNVFSGHARLLRWGVVESECEWPGAAGNARSTPEAPGESFSDVERQARSDTVAKRKGLATHGCANGRHANKTRQATWRVW